MAKKRSGKKAKKAEEVEEEVPVNYTWDLKGSKFFPIIRDCPQ